MITALLSNRTLLANTWAFFVFGYFLFFFMTWLPSYLERKYGLNLAAVGLFTVAPWLAAAVLLWLFGRWSDHLLTTTGRLRIARSYLIAGTQFVAAIAVIPVAMTDDLTVAIAGITVAVAASMGANAAYYAVNVDIVPSARRRRSASWTSPSPSRASWRRHHRLGAEPARLVHRRLPADGGAGAVLGGGRTAVPPSRPGPRPAAASWRARRIERIFVWFWSAALLAAIVAFAVYFLATGKLTAGTPRAWSFIYMAGLVVLAAALAPWPRLAMVPLLLALVEASLGLGSAALFKYHLIPKEARFPNDHHNRSSFSWHPLLQVEPDRHRPGAPHEEVFINSERQRGNNVAPRR